MMKVKVEVERVYVLTLTEEEKVWLQALLQNPCHVEHPDDELPKDQRIRGNMFEALKGSADPPRPAPRRRTDD